MSRIADVVTVCRNAENTVSLIKFPSEERKGCALTVGDIQSNTRGGKNRRGIRYTVVYRKPALKRHNASRFVRFLCLLFLDPP